MIYNINCEKRIVFSIPFHFIFSSPTKLRSFLRSFVTFYTRVPARDNTYRKSRYSTQCITKPRYTKNENPVYPGLFCYLILILFCFALVDKSHESLDDMRGGCLAGGDKLFIVKRSDESAPVVVGNNIAYLVVAQAYCEHISVGK